MKNNDAELLLILLVSLVIVVSVFASYTPIAV
jgi:hypothetical protein